MEVNFSTVNAEVNYLLYSKWCFPADAGAESSIPCLWGNLSFKVGEDELYEFFSSAGHTPPVSANWPFTPHLETLQVQRERANLTTDKPCLLYKALSKCLLPYCHFY